MNHFFLFLGFSTLLAHEMDAVRQAEWRILLGFLHLRDETAYRVFTALHVPLYGGIGWLLFRNPTAPGLLNTPLVHALDAFFLAHVGLHWLFRHHRHYHFTSIFSKTLIGLPGICGALDYCFG